MALLLMAGTSAFAQENKSVAPPRERPTTEQLARKATDRMTAQLKLTEKQAEQAYEATLERLQADEALREQARAAKMKEARGDEIDPFHRAVHALGAVADAARPSARPAGRQKGAARRLQGPEGPPREAITAVHRETPRLQSFAARGVVHAADRAIAPAGRAIGRRRRASRWDLPPIPCVAPSPCGTP